MDPASDAVDLRFTMTADDIGHGARTRAAAAPGGRFARAMLPVAVALLAISLLLFAWLAVAEGLESGDLTRIILAIAAIVVVCLIVVVRRRVYGQVAAQLGEVRAGIDDASVRIANEHSTSANSWSAYGSFVETDRAFVLLSPDRKRIVFTVLPKRGLSDPGDADRLRAILARRLG